MGDPFMAFIAEMDRLLNEHPEAEMAQIFHERGWRSSTGQPLSLTLLQGLRRTYRLKSRFTRKGQTVDWSRQIHAPTNHAHS